MFFSNEVAALIKPVNQPISVSCDVNEETNFEENLFSVKNNFNVSSIDACMLRLYSPKVSK
jgi:hypothetical protein